MMKMDEKNVIWKNTIRKQLPGIWNSNSSASPDIWNIKEGPCEQWKISRTLPAEWYNKNRFPDIWHSEGGTPSAWEIERSLRSGWGCPDAPRISRPTSSNGNAVGHGTGVDFSAMARSGVGMLSGVAKKVGSTAKNAVESANNYAESDEVKNKLNSVRDKAGSLTERAGSSLKGIKDSAENIINEHRSLNDKNAAENNNEVVSDAENTYEDNQAGYDQNYANEAYNENTTPRGSGGLPWAHSVSRNTYGRVGGSYSPAYESPDEAVNYSYATEKKSLVVFVLLGVIGVLILGVGLLGGMLFMNNKNNKNSNNIISDDVSNDTTSSNVTTEALLETSINENVVTTVSAATTLPVSTVAQTTVPIVVQKIVKEYSASDVVKYPQYIKAIKDNLYTDSSSVKYKSFYDISNLGYALYDINADNTPELVISAGGSPDVYSIYNGEAVGLTQFWGGNMVKGIFIYENGYIGMTAISGNGDGGTTYYKYNGKGELESIDYTLFNLQTSENEYYHNGQVVSKEEFDNVTAAYGQQISVSSTPLTNISEIKAYVDQQNSPQYTKYDPSAAGSDFTFNSSKVECRVNVDSGDLNLRAAPSMNGEVILLMPKGAIIYEYGHNHVWSYISYTTGGTTYYGYANKQFIIGTNENVQVISCNKKGTIDASKGEVAGFAGSYVVDGGTSKLIRKSLDNGWHVTAVNYCYSRGILWYELYDTDDNDYYGWVDAGFISFY